MTAWTDLFPQLTLFPLHVIHPGPTCGCGDASCTNAGKHPAVPWRDLEPGTKIRSPHHPHAGYGIATGQRSGIFVVDLDGEAGVNAWEALVNVEAYQHGRDAAVVDTFTVSRGAGQHLYFRHPGFIVPNSQSALAQNVDVRGDGGYIVAPGSPHKSGDRYLVERDVAVQDAPGWLIDWLADAAARTASPGDASSYQYEGDVKGEELAYHEILYRDYLAQAPPCVAKQGGDHQLWLVVQHGAYDLSLPTDVVLQCIREVYDPRCCPPWGAELERRVVHKARCAKEHSTRPPNLPLPLELLEALEGDGPDGVEADMADVTDAGNGVAPDDELGALEKDLKVTWGQWDKEVEPPKYIVQDVVPDDTVGMIVAKGSSLKTWMALSIGIAVATGEPWLGRFAVEKGNVLIVDFESGQWQLRHRVRQLGAKDIPGLGHAAFPNGRIDDHKFWAKLAKLCKAREVRLVIVDSFAAGAPGVEENDQKAAVPLNFASTLTNAVACSVLFIHHAKKGEGGDERDLVRGSGAIYAALDWACTLVPQDDNRTRMKVRNIKPWAKRPDDFGIMLTDSGALLLDVPTVQPEEHSKESEASIEASILAALARPAGSVELVRQRVGKSKAVVGAHLKALVTARKVVELPGIGYALDNEAARLARVEKLLTSKVCRTESAIAAAAVVDIGVVNEWITSGIITKSAEDGGRFLYIG